MGPRELHAGYLAPCSQRSLGESLLSHKALRPCPKRHCAGRWCTARWHRTLQPGEHTQCRRKQPRTRMPQRHTNCSSPGPLQLALIVLCSVDIASGRRTHASFNCASTLKTAAKMQRYRPRTWLAMQVCPGCFYSLAEACNITSSELLLAMLAR